MSFGVGVSGKYIFKVCFASCQDGRLKKGDKLIAVDNQPIVGLSHAEVSCVKFCLSKLKGKNVAVSTVTSETKTRAPSFTSWLRGMRITEVFVILIKNRTSNLWIPRSTTELQSTQW